MATTTLIFENIVIGSFAWAWVVVLLVQCRVVNSCQLRIVLPIIKDYPAPLGVAFLLLVYPIGSMMNTICYALARWAFAKRQERSILKQSELEFDDMISVLKFVGQYGSEQAYADVQIFRPFMRISRAAVVHFLLLGCALLLSGRELLPYALMSFSIWVLALFSCWYSYRFQNEEIVKAYRAIKEGPPKTTASAGQHRKRVKSGR
jgi:hypothetical protein